MRRIAIMGSLCLVAASLCSMEVDGELEPSSGGSEPAPETDTDSTEPAADPAPDAAGEPDSDGEGDEPAEETDD